MNGFQRDVIKTAKAMVYAHRATEMLPKDHEDFQLAVFAVANSIGNLVEAVEALVDYEDSKK